MARVTKPNPEAGTAITNWDEELAKQATVAAQMEANAGGGNFFSTKSGVLSLAGSPMPNNQMAVVIVDTMLENILYDGRFDPDNASPPVCFAFGRDENDINPHSSVVEKGQAQHDQCKGCPMNQWGTADTGKGKACRNTRRLAMIPAGELAVDGKFKQYTDEEHFIKTSIAMMKLPVTSVNGYAAFVKQVAGVLHRPPHGVFTKVKLVPDAKSQFRVIFEALGPVPNSLMAAVMKRHAEAKTNIEQPYSLEAREQEAPARAAKPQGRGVAKPPVKRGR